MCINVLCLLGIKLVFFKKKKKKKITVCILLKFFFIFIWVNVFIKLNKVVGIVVFVVVTNAIFFSLIFWIITFLCKWFYSNKYYKFKLNFYECGFKSLSNYNINYTINFLLIFLFLLIYEGEFFLLVPFVLNVQIFDLFAYFILIYFVLWFVLILLIDLFFNAFDWQL